MKNIINDASVNEWFAQQMTSLRQRKNCGTIDKEMEFVSPRDD